MPEVAFSVVEASQLPSLLPKFWFELRQLAGEYRKKSQKEDEKLLNEVMSLIVASKPVNDWDGNISDQFLNLGFSVVRNSLTKVEREPEADASALQNVLRQTDWLCSVAAASPQLPVFTKAKLCGLWVRSRLTHGIDEADVDSFLVSATRALAPIGLTEDALSDQVRSQLVIHISLLSRNGAATDGQTSCARA